MTAQAALSGIRVVEGPGRFAVPVCASLLMRLGAEVVRADRSRACGGLARNADVLIAEPAAMATQSEHAPVQCAISATGTLRHPCIAADAPEIVLQAQGGLMAATGFSEGSPEAVRHPVLEIFTAVDAAVSILAALRVMEAGGPAQSIDAAVWDTNASLLGTFIAQATVGKAAGYRDGARHPICAPWNAYAARDGFAMICTSSDAQWERLLHIMQCADADARFADTTSRHKHIIEVDALVEGWTRGLSVAEIVARLKKSGIPAGVIASPSAILHTAHSEPFKLSRTPLRRVNFASHTGETHPRVPRRSAGRALDAPLKGIRVVEIGPFTAGPITGRSLRDLGADVVKVEPAGGEVSRKWSPRVGHVSGYFANYNIGKRSVVLDLRSAGGAANFERLLASADVLVQNLKAGALEKLGFGADAVAARHPHLIYCSISGYGRDGAQDAALDTVIQAESGIMGLVGGSDQPCKVGFSIADLLSGHLAVLGIMAALRGRDRIGLGQQVDVSMLGALIWLLQVGADYPKELFTNFVCVKTAQGWVLRRSGESGDHEIAVRELGEVFADPSPRARRMLHTVRSSGGAVAQVLGSPYALARTPPLPGEMIGEAGADLDSVLAGWAVPREARWGAP
jgi:crotonobetainyl-CoA:carnitine CoA-transferase CaiB-like acyl-CoA transferase